MKRAAGLLSPRTLGLCVALVAVVPAYAGRILQYRLDVGDRLVFERQASVISLENDAPLGSSTDEVQFWCLERRGNDILALLDSTRSTSDRAEPARAVVLYLGEGGRRRLPPEIPARLDQLEPALDLLPVLPSGAQNEAEWRTPLDPYQRRWYCIGRGADARQSGLLRVDFVVEDPLGVADVLGWSCSGSYWFDPSAGLVTRFESEDTDRTSGTVTKVVGVLRERLKQSPEWCARRSLEAARFLRALDQEDRLLRDVITHPEALPRTRAELDRAWLAFKSDMDERVLSPFVPVADAQRLNLRAAADTFQARAELGRRWLHQPAGKWTLQDPAGQTVTCETARGVSTALGGRASASVVIECFWSGESVWGLRVLEPMRRLLAELPPQRVRLICYNMDREVERAREVIQRCGGGLTQILGGPLLEVETLPELPVVRVLDGGGIVRDVWIGWQPSYDAARDLAFQLAGVRQ